ncbi:DUF202 domain-containing protein [Planotetraspora sp. GP83]|uniref:DUF202 domain-containing protein n=1 Tax=Planotetraspora sp. GP83 TaxID=3156264 RepID=UPI00351121C9
MSPGLHSERTRLAWVRLGTVLAAAGLGAAGVGLRHHAGEGVTVLFAFAALSGALLLLRTGIRFRRVERALRDGRPLDDTLDARVAWLGVLLLVAGALSLVLTLAS